MKITGQLSDYTRGRREMQVKAADDVLEMVRRLDSEFPGIGRRILTDQDQIRPYVNVFVNKDNARDTEGVRTGLRDGDVVHIVPSVAGG
ncbi:MAG: MoaD/ThiS family protein [Thaumarchaeota archaeon]|nr:MoaD/ThiS family protein [Nitrososphaerota archaeon]